MLPPSEKRNELYGRVNRVIGKENENWGYE
jgi:hypothetical protein